MTDSANLQSLAVTIEARTRAFEKALTRIEKQTSGTFSKIPREAEKGIKGFEAALARADARVANFGRNITRQLVPAAGALAAAFGTRELARMADTWTDLTSRVNLAAGSMKAGAEVMERIATMARRTYSSLEQTAESYLANATALKELGYNTRQQLDFTESLNNALVISAAKGQRAESVMNALSKAMAGGTLQGENLNTVIQSGGRVAEALASGLGVSVNELRKLGSEGKITSERIFRAMTSQMETLRTEAESMSATISDGFQLLQNAMLEYVGKGDQATGVSAKISEALVIMADNFDATADVALQLAGVIAGALVGRSIVGMIRQLALGTAALTSFTRALAAARSMGALSAAFGGLAGAAGPAGLVIGGALVSSLVLFSNTSAKAGEGAKRFADRLKEIEERAESSAEKVEEAGERYNEAMINALGNEVTAGADELERAHEAAVALLSEIIDNAPRRLVSPDQLQSLTDLRDALEADAEKADEAKNALYAMANANPNFQRLADQLSPLLDRLSLVISAVGEARAELDAVSRDPLVEAYQQYGRSRQAGEALRRAAADYEASAIRRAGLSRDQLSLETEIARVRNESLKEGITLTEAQIKRIAEANLDGNKSRSAEGRKTRERADEYERLAQRIEETTAGLLREADILRGAGWNNHTLALEKARTEMELLAAAQKSGRAITPSLRAEIHKLTDQFAAARSEVEALRLESDLLFDRHLMSLSPIDREIAEPLRMIGADINS